MNSNKMTKILKEHLGSMKFDPEGPLPRDNSWPRITVITPSYNQGPYLERTIVSIHNQGYPNLEHIVIDGGSTDGSVDILKRYSGVFTHWQSSPDRGQCDAINIGASHATGKVMTWINSDDLLLPGTLDQVGRILRDDPGIDLVYGNQVEVDQGDRVTKRVFTIDFDMSDFLYEVNIIVNQQSAFWSLDLFREIGGLNECPYAMDYDMFYRMFKQGIRYHRVEDFLSAFRIYPSSLTGSGQVKSSRNDTVDGIFRDAMGRDRNLMDRTVQRYRYKAGRFISEPRAIFAAVEHRFNQALAFVRRPAGS